MKPIEQAIFTFVETDRESGYQTIANSGGVCQADLDELSVWEPSHDSLVDREDDFESLNFHPMPSGNFCLSHTTLLGSELGGRRRAFTHCLIVAPEVLLRFSNNPPALARTVSEQGLWLRPNASAHHLKPILLSGGEPPVDQTLLNKLAQVPGPQVLAALVQAARESLCLALETQGSASELIAGILNCLPLECRLEFSFSTGLKFSPRRPFRLLALSGDRAERAWVASHANVTVLSVSEPLPSNLEFDGWSQWIERALTLDCIPFLTAQMAKRRFDLTLSDLPALGLQLLENLDEAMLPEDWVMADLPERTPQTTGLQQSHAAHQKFQKTRDAAAALLTKTMHVNHSGHYPPEVLEKLELLDDLVYDAIRGQAHSFEKLEVVWPQVLHELGENLLAESREQYLRYALSIWEECTTEGGVRNPAKAIQALDVLCLLFNDVL